MTMHYRENRWPAENTVLIVGSVPQHVGHSASFFFPEMGPKRRIPMSGRLFLDVLHSPDQGPLATGIDRAALELPSRSRDELKVALGSRGCTDLVGLVITDDVLTDAELFEEKMWGLPIATPTSRSTYCIVQDSLGTRRIHE